MRRRWGIGLAVWVLAWMTPAAHAVDVSQLQGLGDLRYHRFESAALGHPLHVYVRLPEAGTETPDNGFPVVYLLDGGVTLPLLAAYHQYLRYGDEVPEMVLVGLSYGSDRFEGGNYRSSDYTAPAADRDWWGGAPTFQRVLAEELMPFVEAEYPARADRRILFGQSLGGQFVLYNALTRPRLFWGLIASNPALHRNLDFFLEWRGTGEAPRDAVRLFVGAGEHDAERFREPYRRWLGTWQARGERPMRLEARELPGQSHFSAAPEAYRAGIQWLFDWPGAAASRPSPR